MTIKSPRYPGHANYIVYFEAADKVTLEMAKQAKFLCHTKVRWNYYSQPKKVRQCGNCYQFGHFKYTCKMNVMCFLCAQSHSAENCPLMIKKLQMGATSIPAHLLTCANCANIIRLSSVSARPGLTTSKRRPVTTTQQQYQWRNHNKQHSNQQQYQQSTRGSSIITSLL